MNHPEIIVVLARANNGVIGADGAIPWRLPADLRRFKRLTMNLPMIMGRRTFDSLPGLLPGRRHIVLTRQTDWDEDGAEPVHSIEAAITKANAPHIAIIGGAEIFAAFESRADRIELTQVHASPDGDASVAEFDGAIWHEAARTDHAAEGGRPAYSFVTLLRR